MTELEKIFITAGITIFGSFVVYVLGLLTNELIAKPFIEYKKVIGEIDEELLFYRNVYTSPIIPMAYSSDEELISFYKHASKQLRRVASKFSSVYKTVRFKKIFKIVNEEEKDIIVGNLISISNSLFYLGGVDGNAMTDNNIKAGEVRTILKV